MRVGLATKPVLPLAWFWCGWGSSYKTSGALNWVIIIGGTVHLGCWLLWVAASALNV